MIIEYPTVEVSMEDLPDADFTKVNPAIYEIKIRGVKYEILIHYKPESRHAVVFGTGAVDKTKNKLPIYSRSTWSDEISATCIYYFDPTLYRSEQVRLCWYYGVNDDWYLEEIARVVEVILNAIHIPIENTLFFGSSGGGFSSVELAVLLKGRATVINPQLFVENYSENVVELFKKTCLEDGESLIRERVDVTELMAKERYVPPIHLFVNTFSKIDTKQQLDPFRHKLQKMGFDLSGLRVTEYSDDAGHNGMPDKYDCIAAIHEDLNLLSRPVEADGEDTAEYMNWLTKPNGLPAEIGDISGCPGKLCGDADSMKRKDPQVHRIYPKTGQYFYRSPSDGEPKDDTWKLVKSGHSVSARRHADDLEFLLYAKGYDIFADSGIYGYSNNIYRKYFLSAMAHNTVIVDNASYPTDSGDDSRVGILSYTFGENYDRVTLFNDSYEGVHITREFYTDRDLTILRDTAESDRYHEYAQLFHLGEHISVYRSDGGHVCLKIADTGYFAHIIQCGDPNRLQIIEGNTEIPIYGLISHAQNHMTPITTLKYDALRKTCTYVTVIAITDADGNVRLHQGSKNISEIQSGDYSAAEDEEKVFARNLSEIPIAHKTSIENGTLHFELTVAPAYLSRLEFAYYLYRGAAVVEKKWKYTKETKQDFQIKESGTYHVRFFIKDGDRSEARWGEEADYQTPAKLSSSLTRHTYTFGIFGSCVSRDLFRYAGERGLQAGQYIARESVISAVSTPVPVEEDEIGLASPFQKKMVLADCAKSAFDRLRSNKSDFLMIDLIDERFDLIELRGGLITASAEACEGLQKIIGDCEKVGKTYKEQRVWFGDEPVDRYVKTFCEKLRGIYDPGQIFLHRALMTDFYLDSAGEARKFSQNQLESNRKTNRILSYMYDLIENCLPGIHVIDEMDGTYASEKHKWGLAPMHYTDEYYFRVLEKVCEDIRSME